MKRDITPKTYFQPNQVVKNTDIRLADARDIVESILKEDYTTTKGLVSNSLYHRLEQNPTFKEARKQGGSDMSRQLFS